MKDRFDLKMGMPKSSKPSAVTSIPSLRIEDQDVLCKHQGWWLICLDAVRSTGDRLSLSECIHSTHSRAKSCLDLQTAD
jgi:hypothetical protein